jgi:radical SAM superfamily enzyme YgiQ (UPF0313 family)
MSSILLINSRPTRNNDRPVLDGRVESYFTALESKGPKLGDTRTEPNNGLLIIGACLKARGHEVAYLDLSALDYLHYLEKGRFLTFEEMAGRTAAAAEKHDMLFFSAIIVGIDDCLKLMDALKKEYPEKTFFLGGTFPSLKPEYCLEHCSSIDVLVVGEGEEISCRAVQAFAEKSFGLLHREQGIFFKERPDSSYHASPGYNLADLHALGTLATPDWDLLDPALTPHVYRTSSARGCGFRCSFCVPSHLSGHSVRTYDKEVFIDSVKRIVNRHKAGNYVMGDLTFLYDQAHGREILKGLIEAGITTPFWCQTHLSRVTPENLELLREAGCCQLAVGVESINPSILANINKGVNEREIVKKIMLIKEHGIEVQTYFIIGLPGDDLDTIGLNKRFIEYGVANGLIDRTHIGIYVPYPGPHMNEEARIESKEYVHYTQGVFRDIPTAAVYSTEHLSRAQIDEAYADTLGAVGTALKARKASACAALDPEKENSIILGAEVLNIAQKMKGISAAGSGRKLVFNIVQGIRAHGNPFISDNIQEVGDLVFANAEVYSADQVEAIAGELDSCVDVFLVDADMKGDRSGQILDAVKGCIRKASVLYYSDTLAWVRAVLNMILWKSCFDVRGKHIFISPGNRHAESLKMMLENFTGNITLGASLPAAGTVDFAVSFGLDGSLIDPGVVECMKPGGTIIDAALGSLPGEIYSPAQEKGITVLRPDMRIVIASEIVMGLGHMEFYGKTVGRIELGGVTFVSGGVVGRPGDVVVDSIIDPSAIIGLADGSGKLIPRHRLDGTHRDILAKAQAVLAKGKGRP